jgi:hypothetical protein
MTTSHVAKALLLAVLVSTGCEPHKPLPAGAVQFQAAGIALVPGDAWQQLRTGPFTTAPDVCLPVLEGQGEFKGGVIQVYSSASDRSDPPTRAASIRREVSARQMVVTDSFKQEDFTTDTGLSGVHVSYDLAVERSSGTRHARTHVYVVKNKKGCCVGVSYSTLAERDSEAVHQMIRKTLILQ